jgi:outer membrane biosynthesis protein TonB
MVHLGSRELKVGSVVPVTIVSNAPPAPPPPAVQGPEELPAQAEAPTPQPVPPTPTPPAPQPQPTPPPPKPTPAPPPKPTPAPTPTPKAAPPPKATPPAPKPVQKGLDLDALDASLAPTKPTGGRASNAQKGPPRAATSPTARDTIGDTLAAGQAIRGLAEELQRRWNPNCDVEGGRDVLVSVTFMIGGGGQVSGTPTVEFRSPRTDVAEVAGDRAVRAVFAASPFRNLPREFYGQRVKVNFIAREACANR